MGEGRTSERFLKHVLLFLCSAPDPDLILLCLRSVPQEGHTVTGSSLDLDGFGAALIPSHLFFPALFSPARAAVSFG